MNLTPYLDDLERRLDPEQEARLERDWCGFARGTCDELFIPRRPPAPAGLEWPHIPVNDTLDDPELLLLRELARCSRFLEQGDGRLLHIRANYGVGILPMAFGAPEFRMSASQNMLPNVRALGPERISGLLDAGVPAMDAGRLADVWHWAELAREQLAPYPLLQRYVHCYHPDLQGPMDVCELLWGSDVFYDLYDEPDQIQALLALICQSYEMIMDRWLQLVPSQLPEDCSCHWGMVHAGRIMLRDDSAMNLSPDMFEEFIAPWDGRLLQRYGGAVHFCGRGDHYIENLTRLPGLRAVNMSQPHLNDLDRIFAHTIGQGLPLLGFDHHSADALTRPGLRRGLIHMHQEPEVAQAQ